MNQDSFADSTPSDAGVGEQLHGAESAPSASHSTITLELGDFLHRIPPGAIKGGPHDVHHALVFERADLEERLKDRDPTIPLSELYLRVPDIFRSSESAKSEVPVRMPYLKVTKMLAHKKVSGSSGSLIPAATQTEQSAKAEAQISTHPTEATTEVEPPHIGAPLGDDTAFVATTHPDAAHTEVVKVVPHEAGSEHGSGEVASVAPSALGVDSFLETESASGLSENYSDFSPTAEPSLEHTQKDSEIASMEATADVPEAHVADDTHGALHESESEAALRRQLAALERQRADDAAELAREREARQKAEELLASELDRRQVGEHEAEHDEEPYEPQFGWELRAVKQLESDIETYRGRIRSLLTERDALQEKNAQLAHQLHTADQPAIPISAPNAGPAPANPVELQNRISQLKQERTALEKARQEALQQLEDVRAGKAEAGAVEVELRSEEVLALRQALEKARRDIEQLKADKELLLEVKKNDSDGAERAASGLNERTVQGLRRSIDAQSKAVSSLTRERDALAEERDALSAELEKSKTQHHTEASSLKQRVSSAESTTAQLSSIKAADDARIQELTVERDTLHSVEDSLRKEVAELQEKLTQSAVEAQETAARFDAELRRADAELSGARAASESAVAAARLESQEKLTELDSLRLAAVEGKAAAEARAADTERAKTLAEGRCKDLETDLENLRSENRELNLRLGDALKERDDTIARLREENRLAVESTGAANQERLEQMESLHHQALEAAQEAHTLALDQMVREHATQKAALNSALETAKADLLHEVEQLKIHGEARAGDHQRAVESLRATHAATLELTKAQHQQALDALHVAHDEELSALRASKDEEIDDLEAASKDTVMLLEAERNQLLLERSRQFSDLKAAHEEQLALSRAEHERSLAAALGERAMAVAERDQRITSLSSDRDRRITEWTTRYEALQAEHSRVVATISAERDAAILIKDQQIAEAQAERDRRLAKLTAEQRVALSTVTASKDFEIAKIREEFNASRVEADRMRAALSDLERRYPAEVARLREDLDAARNESSELTGRLAAAESDSRRRSDQLTREREALLNEKVTLLALLEETRETLRGRTEDFARQIDLVSRQRDEARSVADTARAAGREQAFALDRERNDLLRGDSEQRERTERELARLRRERDTAVRQRDALRERADVLLERQQHLLEDLSRSGDGLVLPASTSTPWEPKGLSGNAPRH